MPNIPALWYADPVLGLPLQVARPPCGPEPGWPTLTTRSLTHIYKRLHLSLSPPPSRSTAPAPPQRSSAPAAMFPRAHRGAWSLVRVARRRIAA